MSRRKSRTKHRGTEPPAGTVTLEEATILVGLGGKSHMTVRRKLAPVRVDDWQPDGSRHPLVMYDAEGAKKIARALKHRTSSLEAASQSPREPRRPLSKLPHGPRKGWATSDEIQQALREHGIEETLFMPRWLRERLLALGVPSEERVVTTRVQRVFPLDPAIGALKADPLVKKKIGR